MVQALRTSASGAGYFATDLTITMGGVDPTDVLVFIGSGDSQNRGFDKPSAWTVLHDEKWAGELRHQVYWAPATNIYGTTSWNWPHDHFAFSGVMVAIAGTIQQIGNCSLYPGNTNVNQPDLMKGLPINAIGQAYILWAITVNGSDPRTGVAWPQALGGLQTGVVGPTALGEILTVAGGSFPGGTTGPTWCEGFRSYGPWGVYATSMISFQSYIAPGTPVAGQAPLLFCEA